MKVFLSSTYEDMHVAYRPAAIGAIQRAGAEAVGMEAFGSNSERADTTALSRVGVADVYALILGFRYGSIAAGSQKSITQLEYEEAMRLEMPVLAFLADDSPLHSTTVLASFPAGSIDTEGDGEGPSRVRKALAAFRKQVLAQHTCAFFVSPQMLAQQMLTAVQREIQGGPTEGHVRLKRGKDALERGDYTTAQFELRMATSFLREDSIGLRKPAARARYLLALAELQGRRPRIAAIQTMTTAHDLLVSAIRLDATCSYLLTLAIMCADFAATGLSNYGYEAEMYFGRASALSFTREDEANLSILGACQPALLSELLSILHG